VRENNLILSVQNQKQQVEGRNQAAEESGKPYGSAVPVSAGIDEQILVESIEDDEAGSD